ncbi:MAG TPA: cobalamin-independent methionine synthase II family protein [Solirubrobacteraceae bacterium]|nr:cobalamin-independent methionine synthase II family protein [Solirubrobacteraceae bacterium]
MANSSKFRADHVGSLLRPQSLLEARRRLEAGMIEAEELREVEDETIAAAVKMQKDAGIDIITDGEFRRRDFRTGFVEAVDGISMRTIEMPWHTSGGVATLPSKQFVITGRLEQRRRLAEGEAAYLQSLTTAPIKVTLIAPGFLVERFWQDGATDEFYESREELAAEVAAITRAEIEALIAEGVRYVQLDNPGYSAYLGSHAREHGNGGDAHAAFERMLSTDIAAIDGVGRPRGMSIGMHVCRGNQSSMWLGEGDYEPIAEQLFQTLPVDRFLLEYDDERAGGFGPLRFMPEGRMVVLGLVSSKTGELESLEELQGRIDEAANFVDIDNLALSPQCGFASVAEGGNRLTGADQFNKLQLVSDAALATWGIEL